MPALKPDPPFYPSPSLAMEAPPEQRAYVAMIDPSQTRPDAMGVVDVKPGSDTYGRLLRQVDMSSPGDELHHFGWNACSAHLCGHQPNPHVERRYLVVPGIHSSRIHIRHETRSGEPEDRQGDRGARWRSAPPCRPAYGHQKRRHLHECAGRT